MKTETRRPDISVVITTYRRPESLRDTLMSLAGQQTPARYEVVVVDNAPDCSARETVDAVGAETGLDLRYDAHPYGGNAGARNRGVLVARGRIVLFTDDDLLFAPGWVAAYVQAFADTPGMVAAGGRVKPCFEGAVPSWLERYLHGREVFGVYAMMDLGERFRNDDDVFFFGCNMAFRREVFDEFGFHPEIFGTRTLGDGESGLLDDLRRAGKRIGYVPEAEARHRITPGRMTVRYLRRWMWHHGGGVMYNRLRGERPTPGAILREAGRLLREHGARQYLNVLLYGRTDSRSIERQCRASLIFSKWRYLWWAAFDPFTRRVLEQADFRPEHGGSLFGVQEEEAS